MEGPARRAPPPSSGVDGRGVETAIPSGGRGEKEGEGGRGREGFVKEAGGCYIRSLIPRLSPVANY